MYGKKWTKKEVKDLLKLINKCSTKKEAYQIHALRTGRSVNSVNKYALLNLRTNNRKYDKWSNKETEELLKLVEKNPDNLLRAYKIHANKTGRSLRSVIDYFQRYRVKQDAKVCMMVVGRKKYLSPNRKNVFVTSKGKTGGTVSSLKQSKWKRILAILFE